MNCPRCNDDNDTVYDSRAQLGGCGIWRRRKCKNRKCGHRWTTSELPDETIKALIKIATFYADIDDALTAHLGETRDTLAQFYKITRK